MSRPIDSPIIIAGGSPLILQAKAGWTVVSPNAIATPFPNHTVTSVEVTSGDGKTHTVPFHRELCEIGFMFGLTRLAVRTDEGGRNLCISLSARKLFATHFELQDKTVYRSKAEGMIQRLKITQPGVAHAFETTGHTTIVIHYVGAGAAPKVRQKAAGA
jgi:hypothetical protein